MTVFVQDILYRVNPHPCITIPTLHLGHSKRPGPSKKAAERWETRIAQTVSDTTDLKRHTRSLHSVLLGF